MTVQIQPPYRSQSPFLLRILPNDHVGVSVDGEVVASQRNRVRRNKIQKPNQQRNRALVDVAVAVVVEAGKRPLPSPQPQKPRHRMNSPRQRRSVAVAADGVVVAVRAGVRHLASPVQIEAR